MLQHQRDILAHMGIDIWLSRQHIQTRPHQKQFFRDQVVAPSAASSIHSIQHPLDTAIEQTATLQQKTPQHSATNPQLPANSTAVAATASLSVMQKSTTPEVDFGLMTPDHAATTSAESLIPSSEISLPAVSDVETQRQVAPFELQAVTFEHAVLVIESSNLSHAEQRLWRNIQALWPHQFNVLKWPLPLENLQDGRGAQYYVAGFLTAQAIHRPLIALGHLVHVQDLAYQTAPSLKEMLAQPQRKAALWQLLSAAVA